MGVRAEGEEREERETVVRVSAGAPLTVECRLRPEQRAQWQRDGGALPPEMRPVPEAPAPDGRLTARLRAAAARAHLAGTYTCTPERDQRVRVLVQPAAAPVSAPASGTAAHALAHRSVASHVRPTPISSPSRR